MATVFLSPTACVRAENTCNTVLARMHTHTHTHTAPMDTAHVISSTHGNTREETGSSTETETREALCVSGSV